MSPNVRTFNKQGTVAIPLNGQEGFGLDAGTIISVTSSGSGVKVVIWPTGSIAISNTSGVDRTVDVSADNAPMIPGGMTLQSGFYAIITTREIRVYNNYGELQTGFTSQNAA